MRQRRQKRFPKLWPTSPVRVKPVLKQPAEQRFVARERDHAVAYIAWRQNPVFAAQAAELPPSSVTVTIAARSVIGRFAVGVGSLRGTT